MPTTWKNLRSAEKGTLGGGPTTSLISKIFGGPGPLIFFVVLFGATSSLAHADGFAWVQLGSGQEVSVRAIVKNGACPTLSADGAPREMTVRAHPNQRIRNVPPRADFTEATACEAKVPRSTTALLIGDAPLPLPRPDIRRIVVLGDSGCRIKKSGEKFELQDCNDVDAWPYAKVARHAAAAKPDLVIHVGDYLYRESECPSPRNCAGPSGYGYDSWKADFFEPSQPLFQAAPWIMVRGNHEDCMQRAGEGWFRFLDHAPLPQECSDLTGFFVVEYPDLNFLVMDNARAEAPKSDAGKRTQVINQLSEQFSKFRDSPLLQRDTWLLSHRPFNGLRFGNDAGYRSDNDIQQEAVKVDDREKVRMIVSGHIHIFEALSFGNSGPPQLVVGTAGDNLEDIPPQQIIGAKINDKSVEHGLVFARFGYMVWDKTAAGWTGRFFDDDGRQLAHCSLEKRSLTCTGKEDN